VFPKRLKRVVAVAAAQGNRSGGAAPALEICWQSAAGPARVRGLLGGVLGVPSGAHLALGRIAGRVCRMLGFKRLIMQISFLDALFDASRGGLRSGAGKRLTIRTIADCHPAAPGGPGEACGNSISTAPGGAPRIRHCLGMDGRAWA
jgi:hypothetical protein